MIYYSDQRQYFQYLRDGLRVEIVDKVMFISHGE